MLKQSTVEAGTAVDDSNGLMVSNAVAGTSLDMGSRAHNEFHHRENLRDSSPLTEPPQSPRPDISLAITRPYLMGPPQLPPVDLLSDMVGKQVHDQAETIMWPCGWKTVLPTLVKDGFNILEAVCTRRCFTDLKFNCMFRMHSG